MSEEEEEEGGCEEGRKGGMEGALREIDRREDCVLRGVFRPELESGDLTAKCPYLPSNALTFSNPCFRSFFMTRALTTPPPQNHKKQSTQVMCKNKFRPSNPVIPLA
jgi:hypothetical protein